MKEKKVDSLVSCKTSAQQWLDVFRSNCMFLIHLLLGFDHVEYQPPKCLWINAHY